MERVYIPPTLLDIGEIHFFLILHKGPFFKVFVKPNEHVFHGLLYCLNKSKCHQGKSVQSYQDIPGKYHSSYVETRQGHWLIQMA